MADDPYSRQYWRFIDEYPDIYADDAAYALWSRLLIAADMAWPSSASLPRYKPRALGMLTVPGLVELLPADRFRIPSMDKHRSARSNAARDAVAVRWNNARSTGVSASDNGRIRAPIPSRAEPIQAEPSTVAMRPEEARTALDNLHAQMKASGIPLPSKEKTNGREPYTDTDVIEHCRSVIADDTAPDWKRDAARAQLEAMRAL